MQHLPQKPTTTAPPPLAPCPINPYLASNGEYFVFPLSRTLLRDHEVLVRPSIGQPPDCPDYRRFHDSAHNPDALHCPLSPQMTSLGQPGNPVPPSFDTARPPPGPPPSSSVRSTSGRPTPYDRRPTPGPSDPQRRRTFGRRPCGLERIGSQEPPLLSQRDHDTAARSQPRLPALLPRLP